METLTRRSLLIGMSTVALASATSAFSATGEDSLVFTGGYTDQGSKGLGIYAWRWNAKKGELVPLGLAGATPNPSFLAITPNRTHLYAVNEITSYKGKKDGSVSAFSVDTQSGKLASLNVVSSAGSGPCHISLDHTATSVLVANYDAGTAATFLRAENGSLSHAAEFLHYDGKGPNTDRQTSAHIHCATATPDNGHVLFNDLGLDRIHIYKLDPATARLTASEQPLYMGAPDSGPRSLVFHPNGHIAYSTNELSNTIDVLAWEAKTGKLTRVQNLPTATHPGDTKNTVASVVIDRNGEDLYVSNRGPQNSIAHFSIHPVTGELTFREQTDSGGKTPRHFAIDPTGKWLIVANQGTNNLVVFERKHLPEGASQGHQEYLGQGSLVPTGRSYPSEWPTCVLFA